MNQRLTGCLLGIQVVLVIGNLHVMSASLKSERTGPDDTNTSEVKMEHTLSEDHAFFANTSFNESFVDFLKQALKARYKAKLTRLKKPSLTEQGARPQVGNTVPRVNGLGFEPENKARVPNIASLPRDTGAKTGAHGKGNKEEDTKSYPTHLIVLLVGSFLGGITLTSSVGMLIYLYKRKRWKERNITVEADLNSPKFNDTGSSTGTNEVTTDEDSLRSSEGLTREDSITDSVTRGLTREDSVTDSVTRGLVGKEMPPATERLGTGTAGNVVPDHTRTPEIRTAGNVVPDLTQTPETRTAGNVVPDLTLTPETRTAGNVVPDLTQTPETRTAGNVVPDLTVFVPNSTEKCQSYNLEQPQRPGDLALSDLVSRMAVVSSDPTRANIVYLADQIGAGGGAVQSPDSDVSVIVPPSSVPADVRSLVLRLKVDLSGDALAGGRLPPACSPRPDALAGGRLPPACSPRPVQLSPVVELVAQGTDSFPQPVIVKLPHRVHLTDGSTPSSSVIQNCPINLPPADSATSCKLKVLQTHSANEDSQNSTQWREVPQYQGAGRPIQPAYFTFDKEFVFVHTYRPMTLVAVGCVPFSRQKENTQRLKMSVLTYGNYVFQSTSGRWQADLRVYVCDGFRDAYQMVKHKERSHGGCRQSPLKEILLDPLSDLRITLSDATDPAWTWRISENFLSSKVITSDLYNQCAGTPIFVHFRCESTTPCEQQPPFLANITVSQSQGQDENSVTDYYLTATDNFLNTSL